MAKIKKTDAEWKQELTAEQFKVARQHGTEPAFTGIYWDNKDEGMYRCACCDTPLFDSQHKYDSGSGWPSYWQPVDEANVETQGRPQSVHEAHRGALQKMRRAPGPYIRRRAAADGAALLHQFGVAQVRQALTFRAHFINIRLCVAPKTGWMRVAWCGQGFPPWQAARRSRRPSWGQPVGTGRFWPHGGVARHLLGMTQLHSSRLATEPDSPRRTCGYL